MLKSFTKKYIQRYLCKVNLDEEDEIISWDQFRKLKVGDNILIMNNCDMVLANIYSHDKNTSYVTDNVNIISINENSFEYRNFMYDLRGYIL